MTELDYDAMKFRHARFASLAQYVAPMLRMPGMHRLSCSTRWIGGPDGLSGSPVLRITFRDDNSVARGLAGMVVLGGHEELTFVDATHLLRLVHVTAAHVGRLRRRGALES